MKKLTALFLSLAMVLSLAACGTGTSNETSVPETSTPSASSETQEPSAAPESTGNTEEPSSQPETGGEAGGTLVVYYSATGNTEQVANYIADITGGDLFELEPVEPYTSDDLDWTDDNSRVSQEYYDESLRDVELVADTIENWDSYDTIFIGYPIWWGEAPRIVSTFIESYDFSGKTVVTFSTSGGSGHNDRSIKELASGANWVTGARLKSNSSQSDVADWITGLGLDITVK